MSLRGEREVTDLSSAVHQKAVACGWSKEQEDAEYDAAYSVLMTLLKKRGDGSISKDEYNSALQQLFYRFSAEYGALYGELKTLSRKCDEGSISRDEYSDAVQRLYYDFTVQCMKRSRIEKHKEQRGNAKKSATKIRRRVDWQLLFARLLPLLLFLALILAGFAIFALSDLLQSTLHLPETAAEIISAAIVIVLVACIVALCRRIKQHGGITLSYLFSGREHKEKCRFLYNCARNTILAACSNNADFCEKLFLPELAQIVRNDRQTVSTFRTNFDYEKCVLDILFTLSSRRVTSGEYHFYRDSLTFNGHCIADLSYYCLSRAKEIGMIDETQYKQLKDNLSDGISTVG